MTLNARVPRHVAHGSLSGMNYAAVRHGYSVSPVGRLDVRRGIPEPIAFCLATATAATRLASG